jgi:hypothetical protein
MADNGAPTLSPVAELPPIDALHTPFGPAFADVIGAAAGDGAPQVIPPTAVLVETGEGIAAAGWHNGKAVTRLYHHAAGNAWIALAGVGWKRLNPASESGAGAMAIIAAHAVDNGLTVNAYEGADGYIHQLYCW